MSAAFSAWVRWLEAVLFLPLDAQEHRRVRVGALLAMLAAGLAHWALFFHWGVFSLRHVDWLKEAAYLNTLRQAVESARIPWRWNESFYHDVQNFLGIPEVVLTPDVLLLPLLTNGEFVVAHVFILYTAGFAACLALGRRLGASLIAFLFFWVLFSFNGHITAHLGIGHFQWSGYFLLPVFFALLARFEAAPGGFRIRAGAVAPMSLLLGALFLNGSLHVALWCCLFLALMGLWRWSAIPTLAAAIAGGGLLGACRLLPAAVSFPSKYLSFVSGYPGFTILLESFTTLRDYNTPTLGGRWGTMGWWEFDLYTGWMAFVILIVVLASGLRSRPRGFGRSSLLAAALMAVLAYGDVYAPIAKSPLPFAGVERVSTRFLVMSFLLAIAVAMPGIDSMLRALRPGLRLAVLFAFPFVVFELGMHSFLWRVSRLEFLISTRYPPTLEIVANPDSLYAACVVAGWAVSILTLGALGTWWVRERRAGLAP
jgi:hypothetical protein